MNLMGDLWRMTLIVTPNVGKRGSLIQGKSVKTFLFMCHVELVILSRSVYEWKQKGAVEWTAEFVLQ